MSRIFEAIKKNYDDLITNLEIRKSKLTKELADLEKKNRNVQSSNYIHPNSTNSQNALKQKLAVTMSVINETIVRRGHILRLESYYADFKDENLRISDIFAEITRISLNDLKHLDRITIADALTSNLTCLMIYEFYNTNEKYRFIDRLLTSSKQMRFKNFDPDVYQLNLNNFEAKPEGLKYLPSVSVKSLQTYVQLNPSCKLGKGTMVMLEKCTSQARVGTIWTQLLSMIRVKQIESSSHYYSNILGMVDTTSELMHATDTYSFQTIIRLLKEYTVCPFIVKSDRLIINQENKVDWSTSLPILLSILINGVLWEMNGVLDNDSAIAYINHVIASSEDSVIDYYLKWKSKFREWTKLMIFKSKKFAVLDWCMGAPTEIKYQTGASEVEIEDEKVKISKLIEEYPQYYRDYVNKVLMKLSNLTTSNKDGVLYTLFMRHVLITSHTISCGSNYLKTSNVLCLDKAYGTRINSQIQTPKLVEEIQINGEWIPSKYDFSSMGPEYATLEYNMRSLINSEGDGLKLENLENITVGEFKNRSSGVKYSDFVFDKPDTQIDALLTKKVKEFSQTRLLSYLLTSNHYSTYEGIEAMLNTRTKAGAREQIDRRKRIISVVPNAQQLSDVPFLATFDQIKSKHEEIAMGKQIGNIFDQAFQLRYSSSESGFLSSSDVSGMDASMLKQVVARIRSAILEEIKTKSNDEKIFAFSTQTVNVRTTNPDGSTSLSRRIATALEIMVKFIDYKSGKQEMSVKDGCFTDEVPIPMQTFESGRYFTSGNHTIFLVAAIRTFFSMNDWPDIDLRYRVLGDDIIFYLVNVLDKAIIQKFLAELRKFMEKFNIKLEIQGSRFMGEFLQQEALCGICVPKPARASLFNAEKNEVTDRNPLQVIEMIILTSHNHVVRGYSSENIKPFIRSLWYRIRCKEYFNPNKYKFKQPKYKGELVTKIGDRIIIITLPLLLISVAPLSYPPILIKHGDRQNEPLSILAPRGDFSYIYWFGMFMNSKFSMDFLKINNQRELVTKILEQSIDWDLRSDFGITLSEYLIKFKRNSRLTEYKKQIIGPEILNVLQERLLNYVNKERLQSSRNAVNELLSLNIKIPRGITFEGRERSKIIASFESKMESLEETEYVDREYFEYINSYQMIPYANARKIIINTYLYKLTELDTETPVANYLQKANFMTLLPLIPAAHLFSDFYHLALKFGFPRENDFEITKSISQLGEDSGFAFDASRTVEEGVKVYKANRQALDLFITAIGLPLKQASKLRDIIIKVAGKGISEEYQSIYDLNKYFINQGDASVYSNILNDDSIKIMQAVLHNQNHIDLMCRDFAFALGARTNGKVLSCYGLWASGIYSIIAVQSRG